ncbi:ABC transporter substrate-binding protein [Enterovirga sp. DB1703]|uniref:ABC transporter substrate-binding protein n=1 Tax=Enterovirga aerilata TaxID=2730920 RepID=A0A849ID14_9HYPH|nr:ABC transporter substrate-binding protein [Enterovirga sp. DB1703]
MHGGAALAGAATLGMPSILRAQSGKPVKVGVLGDFSTAYASVGGPALLEAVRMAVEDAGGSALGKPVEVVSADTQLKPDLASTIARSWFDVDGVDVITDLPTSAMTFAVMDLARERKKIVLATSASSSDITGPRCSPYVAHWVYDTYSIAHSTASALVKQGAKTWFFITQDTVAGTISEKDVTDVIKSSGGRVLGSVRVPNNSNDYSSFILQAQGSKADVIVYSVAGADAVRAVKQASEFGVMKGGQRMIGTYTMPDDIKAMGLDVAQGLIYATAFDWNLNDETRAYSHRFLARTGKMPNMNMAGSYSAVLSYLKAVEAAGNRDADQVMAKLRGMTLNDVFVKNGKLREDGRMAHGMYVMEAKAPSQSTGEWDLAKVLAEVSTETAVRPLAAGNCPLVK